MRSSIIRLLHLTVDEGVSNADDAGVRSGLWSQAYSLADLLLDALKLYADSCEDNLSLHAQVKQDVQTERSAILELFLKAREFDRAAVLAEKYIDFGALLTICDETMNEDKLNVYIDKLGESGFTEFACRWYGLINVALLSERCNLSVYQSLTKGTCSAMSVKSFSVSVGPK